MKASKYNYYFTENDCYYIYNQIAGSFTQVDEDLYHILQKNEIKQVESEIPSELMEELTESNFVCEEDLVEENRMLRINRLMRYSNDHARITIMPTIDCNFKCWYCYESHTPSQMSPQGVDAVILFITQLITGKKLKSFHLDWFGGEPLMYFEEVMYPIGLKVKELCEDYDISFGHFITTNGYLITEDMVDKMSEIGLRTFQITLDGSSKYHNKTRFSTTDKETYTRIVDNITLLCRKMEGICMDLRINYTPKNIHTIEEIAYSFPEDVRDKINIHPQLVWQFKSDINTIDDTIKEKVMIFSNQGYRVERATRPVMNRGCYVENMLQYVINYDLSIYKCTARDFVNKKFSVGSIDEEGIFRPNANYYNYFVSSYMENPECLACSLLPSCHGMCIQKKVEGSMPVCSKENVEKSLLNRLRILIQQ